MIDTVSTSPVQSSALRYSPQSTTRSAEPVASANPSSVVNSRIRVDNLQDVAILEYRSSEGEVIRQYPTPAQIQAFKRAEEIATEVRGQTAQSSASAPAESVEDGPSPASSSAESSAPATESAAPVAQASAPSYAPPAAGGKSTQSVVV